MLRRLSWHIEEFLINPEQINSKIEKTEIKFSDVLVKNYFE
jgi:hypothetical protein